jgi:hypothetical protein
MIGPGTIVPLVGSFALGCYSVPRAKAMPTKGILFGMNILTLAGFALMGLTLTLNRMGQAGKALSIGLTTAGTALVFVGLYLRRALVTGLAAAMRAPKRRTPAQLRGAGAQEAGDRRMGGVSGRPRD